MSILYYNLMKQGIRSTSSNPKVNSFLKRSINIIVDPQKTQDLRNRLIDRGISPMPLPSVKRPKITNSSLNKPRLPIMSVFNEDRTPDVSFIKSEPKAVDISIVKPRAKDLKEITEERANPSGFISVGKLRPSTAARNKSSKREHNSSFASLSRPITSQQNLPHKPGLSHNFSNEESVRAMHLLHKMQGSRKYIPAQPAFSQVFIQEEENFKEKPAEKLSEIDSFIKSIQEDKKDQGFIYCLETEMHNPYELKKVISPQGFQEYYTISKKGIALFVNGSPIEFTRLADWLVERKAYNELKSISFFKKFRIWKTCIMWKRNVNRYRRNKRSKKLEEKLFWVDKVYSELILEHKSLCNDIERTRFLDLPTNPDGFTLEAFKSLQDKRQNEIKSKLHEIEQVLRDNINTYIRQIMDELREKIVSDIASEKNVVRGGPGNLAPPNKRICPLYEKLGFPENMTFGQRSLLRKECSRFLRFSYLADFYVLESLYKIYIWSCEEFVDRITDMVNMFNSQEIKTKRLKHNNPLFVLNMKLKKSTIKDYEKVFINVHEFIPHPHGTSHPDDFYPPLHLSIMPESGEDPNFSPSPEDILGTKPTVPNILNLWLELTPDLDSLVKTLIDIVENGVRSILVIERWSRHPEIEDFATALEDWDDKVAQVWEVAQDLTLSPRQWLNDHKLFNNLAEILQELLSKGYDQALSLVGPLHYYVHTYWENSTFDLSIYSHERLRNQKEAFNYSYVKFHSQLKKFNGIPTHINTQLLSINCTKIKETVIESPKKCLNYITTLLPELMRKRTNDLKDWFAGCIKNLPVKVSNVEEFMVQRNSLVKINLNLSDKKILLGNLSQLYGLAEALEMPFPKEDLDELGETIQIMTILTNNIIFAESNNDKYVSIFRKDLNSMVPDLISEVSSLLSKVNDDKYLRIDSVAAIIISELEDYSEKCSKIEKRGEKIKQYQKVLDLAISSFNEIEVLRDELDTRLSLWKALRDWRRLQSDWISTPFFQINAKSIRERSEDFSKIVGRCESSLPLSSALKELKKLVFTFRETMPVVEAMRVPLEDSHWRKIKEIIGKDFEINNEFTLGDLIKLNVVNRQEEISAVATQAAQESQLKSQLEEVKALWQDQELPVQIYKDVNDVYILGDLEEMLSTLDDSCAKLSNIAGNRYVAVLRDDVSKWKDDLNTMQDIMEEWINCQKSWMYLQNIFVSGDIKKHLHNESGMFEGVDKFFKNLMKKTSIRNQALRATIGVPGLLSELKRHNVTLDQVQKQLNKYLETKRRVFPRFYFLSDDELLQILANSQDIQKVQPHLKKCFDNIYALDFGPEPKSIDIYAMESQEGEKVSFAGKLLKARGNVEDWLSNVQAAMVEILTKSMVIGKEDLETTERKAWVLKHPGQIVATNIQTSWCNETENALELVSDHASALDDWLNTNIAQLEILVGLVRGNLTSLQRKIIVALITTDVHSRDIVQMLKDEEVQSVQDFYWQQQLRYYWDKDDVIVVRQINAVLYYGYEYMGATSRLVITPLTDRCWITITSALNIKLGASPAGPAGTGKTESTKDLAKAIGMQCVVFNCSEQITYKMMGRLFSGLAQQGAWSCLDEFNRIDIEVLSVIAQQLLTIQNALRENAPDFFFEDSRIPLKPGCGVFITMNPGYAGRTELPDNLKVCFRPVAMMIPDYGMIAEIMLLAEGFSNANVLSKKMVQLYKLASEQLSQQDHYDFGMRAVKSVLVMAGEVKRNSPNLIEDLVLIRAMRDSNIPKFISHDIPLFEALVKDLFPSVNIGETNPGDLERQIVETIALYKLQRVKQFEKKVSQLFDTLTVRFGVMLVGPTGSGKSTCLKVLSHCISKLKEKGNKDVRYQKVDMTVINPKCISMGELYGEVNPLTQDWKEGLASSLMRNAAAEKGEDKKWIVFDGPVDSLWIENLNTVLDDNMMLCLANGERIKLRLQMRILFEVQDLAVASPATVSRCGMVYLSQEDLGWKPYVQSWIQITMSEDQHEFKNSVLRLFETIFPPLLKFKKSLEELINISEIQAAANVCKFLEVFLDPNSDHKLPDPPEEKIRYFNAIFVFSFIWGVGGSIKSNCREKFSDYSRQIFSQSIALPISDTLYDYYLQGKSFKHWNEKVPEFNYDPEKSYFSLVVPTIDSTSIEYILSLLYIKNHPVLITGETGVGKSVIISSFISRMNTEGEIEPVLMNFSAQTSSLRTQSTIESKIERKSKGFYSAVGNKKLIIFVDDLNMPSVEVYGAQPPIELLRSFIDFKGFYDRQKLFWKKITNYMMISACAPPGGGRNQMTPRFMRHFNIISLPEPSTKTLTKIFGSLLGGFLELNFSESVKKTCEAVVSSTIEIYFKIITTLKPTPTRFHYMFNLRDVSKVFQGILMASYKSISSPDQMSRLWIHECCRVFHDRLISNDDTDWFTGQIAEQISKQFKLPWTHEEIFINKKIIFSSILNLNKPLAIYEEISDTKKLLKELYLKLDDYNTSSTKKMNLVFFDIAVDHVLRITRTLKQPRGNMLLIGVGGSGKQTLTILSSYILSYSTYQIELTRNYTLESFREDLKKMMEITGVEGNNLAFVLTDTQISNESFLEDINSILNTGEVTSLFEKEDIDGVINRLRPEVVGKMKLPDSNDVIYSTFVQRVRDKLHIVLCMSPVGETLRIRCRKFPSIVNCATLDWFSKWPEEALLSVSSQFIKQLSMTEDLKKALSEMCMEIHTSVEQASDRFFVELRRKMYITPKSYLDLISFYISQLEKKKLQTSLAKTRLENGLSNLKNTRETVNTLQDKLQKMAPELEIQKKKTEEYYKEVQRETKSAEVLREQVEREKEIVNHQMMECRAKAEEAEEELAQSMPILERAIKALDSINPKDISEMKNYKNPPVAVKMVLESVCILLAEPTDWPSVLHVIGRMDFLERLRTYNKDDIPKNILRKLKHYLTKSEYDPELIGSKSLASKSLCTWCIAMNQYSEAFEVVKPKKERVLQMQVKLESDMQKLRDKEKELQDVQDKVTNLKDECQATEARMIKLEKDIETTKLRLIRAEQLLDLLADEGVRWEEGLVQLKKDMEVIIGNVFLSAASVSYLGPFTGSYRKELITKWVSRCNQQLIPCAEDFVLEKVLSTPVVIQEWNIAGLPSDSVCVVNGIITTTSQRWPLMIDPQMQGHNWIKNMEKTNDLKILKMKSFEDNSEKSKKEAKDFIRTLEFCVTNGKPILFEDLGETLDPSVDPLISKQYYKEPDGRVLMKLGDNIIVYDPNFKLYLTTKLPNPHYLPEVSIKVNIINFTVTFPGLEEQLLADVVKIENNQVEQQKNQLITQMAADNKLLKEIQDSILQLIGDSTGNILDDTKLIETMQKSKYTSKIISERMTEASMLEQNLNQVREGYRVIAIRGAILYFVIVEMSRIDPMYQYSLVYIKKLFNSSIENAEPSKDISKRISILIEALTRNIYTNICRSLFETHKYIFSFLIASSINRNSGVITSVSWNLLLRGAGLIAGKIPAKPNSSLINKNNWELIYSMETQIPSLEGLCKSITSDLDSWISYSQQADLYNSPLPGAWEKKFDDFNKLLIVRCLRTDKLLLAFIQYVKKTIGNFFTESPPGTMDKLYADSDKHTPVIFVLSQGADPTISLMNFAQNMDWSDKVVIISLGQGQGPRAQAELNEAKKSGKWLVLQNCHLAKSWMPSLEKLVQELQEDNFIMNSFRLFLTSMPTDYFPVSVLQNGLKMTTEPPRGIKANLKSAYAELTEEQLNDSSKPGLWKKFLFALSFFHATVQERRKFGSLGFNIKYEFNASDLDTSKKFLKKFLEENEDIPWDALIYLTGHINYGGRVTDDWDRNCLLSTLKKFYTKDILEENYLFSESGIYYAPNEGDIEVYRGYIENLPQNDLPEIFGLHENANISYQTQESEKVLNTILSIQPRESAATGEKTGDEVVIDFTTTVLDSLPQPLDPRQGFPDLFVKVEYDLIPSLSTVLLHEIERFNNLLKKMKSSMQDLQKAIKGEIVMSQDLDEMYSAILIFQVPPNWKKVSYPSLKALSSWVSDLKDRVSFMEDWLRRGNPSSYWLSGFFFPQSFITGTLQTFSRKHKISIDGIKFSYNVLDKDKEDVTKGASEGVYVYGLYLDGARWDRDDRLLEEPLPGELYCKMPVIHFLPTDDDKGMSQDYTCPVYKTSVRAGVLSTTGQSTNFIISIDLPISEDEQPEHWTLRGTALLCQLND
jgi:dynein heavy chain, axonemal